MSLKFIDHLTMLTVVFLAAGQIIAQTMNPQQGATYTQEAFNQNVSPQSMGGGVIGASSWGDTHSGTWSVVGPLRVRLSGDGNQTPYTQDMSLLNKQ